MKCVELILIITKMDLNYWVKREYDAQVKRGKIDKTTSIIEFINKIKDEFDELFSSYISSDFADFDPLEAIDVIKVCCSMLYHFDCDIEKLLEEKTIINENRKD